MLGKRSQVEVAADFIIKCSFLCRRQWKRGRGKTCHFNYVGWSGGLLKMGPISLGMILKEKPPDLQKCTSCLESI